MIVDVASGVDEHLRLSVRIHRVGTACSRKGPLEAISSLVSVAGAGLDRLQMACIHRERPSCGL